MGDGIAAAFTSAEAAVRAAIAAQRQMPAIGLAVRMGIHTGEVERVGDDFRGRPVNRAARIMAVGHGGQILLSDVSAALVRTGPAPRRARRPRHPPAPRPRPNPSGCGRCVHPDLAGAVPAGAAASTATPTTCRRQRSSLVGRELRRGPRGRACSQQHRIVTLTGVGGVGKTRLGRARRGRRCCRSSPACGSSSWPA